jgi:hypothetical protein
MSRLVHLFAKKQLPIHAPQGIVAALVNAGAENNSSSSVILDQLRSRVLAFKPEQAFQVLFSCRRANISLSPDLVEELRECLIGPSFRVEPSLLVHSLEILRRMEGPFWDPSSIANEAIVRRIAEDACSASELLKLCRIGFGAKSSILNRAIFLLQQGAVSIAQSWELALYLNDPALVAVLDPEAIPRSALAFGIAFSAAWNHAKIFQLLFDRVTRNTANSLSPLEAQLVLSCLLARRVSSSHPLLNHLRIVADRGEWNCLHTKHLCLSLMDNDFEVPYPIRLPLLGGQGRKLALLQRLRTSLEERGAKLELSPVVNGKFFADLRVNEAKSVLISTDPHDPFFRINAQLIPEQTMMVRETSELKSEADYQRFVSHLVS